MTPINQYIDHTLLKADATHSQILQLCKEAKEYSFYAVCVNSTYVPVARKNLSQSGVKICSVVGFPLGAMSEEVKNFEAKQAVEDGADEIDMVLNIGALKSKFFQQVEDEISLIKQTVGDRVLKIIVETCFMTPQEIVLACELAVKAGADFVKTSTGFGPEGARLDHIELMKTAVDGKAKIKASGGIRTLENVQTFLEAGVSRIGTSSGVSILKEMQE